MIGFSGVMKALYISGVLDCVTYVAGLSGSTSVNLCADDGCRHFLQIKRQCET